MIKIFSTRLLLVTMVLSAILFNSCGTDPLPVAKSAKDYNSEVVQAWNNKYLEIERYAAGYRPGPAPRSLAYIGLACYESCIQGMPEYRSIKGNFTGLVIPEADPTVAYHYPTVVNAVYSYMMRQYFTVVTSISVTQLASLGTLNDKLNSEYKKEVDVVTFDKSKAYGEAVAKAVYEWSKTDLVGHDHHLDPFKDNIGKYKAPVGAGYWIPTIPGPAKPMFPDWGYARTFAISDADKLCKKPLAYSENPKSTFYTQGLEVRNTVQENDYDNRWLAFFWSDDLTGLTFSPGPRWMAIENQVLAKLNSNLETAVYANAKLGMAINDAAVACWYSKYTYNIERPESYIKRVIDPTFEPMLYNPLNGDKGFTPPFPAYPSGHSTMGGAGAEVLTNIFGSSFAMVDYCHQGRNDFEGSNARSFGSFYPMAEENAISRLPLGVHFRMDCEEGLQLGYRCGRRVNNLNWKR